ncbi:hypothetical protein J4465_00305 [Candidatus Pacearchaeota archaeon]|nr:hypothetical protein [Candidatus Pacearchaeota archaeon]
MIITKKPLFNGTNEKYWDFYNKKTQLCFLEFWTTSPIDAIIHAKESTKRHGSKMMVTCLNVWNSFDFELYSKGGFGPEENTEWYKRIAMPNNGGLFTPKLIKEKFLENYREVEIDKLVERYCDDDQKDFYKKLKEGWKNKK